MARTRPELERALAQASGCLFLCSGNMIRSAFAELYARHLGWGVPVRSAGTCYWNPGLHAETRRALLGRGVAPATLEGFSPRLIGALDPAPVPTELLLGMTRVHLEEARAAGLRGPAFLLTEVVGEDREIADPYFDGGFASVFDDVARCVEELQSKRPR